MWSSYVFPGSYISCICNIKVWVCEAIYINISQLLPVVFRDWWFRSYCLWFREMFCNMWSLFTYWALSLFVPNVCTWKKSCFARSGLLNEQLWEAVVLPQGRPCSTLVRVRYATAITVDERIYSRLTFESAMLCFERRRMRVNMIAGYICFQKYLTLLLFCRNVTYRLFYVI